MSVHEHLFIASEVLARGAAQNLASVLKMEVTENSDGVYLWRPAIYGAGGIGGEVRNNIFCTPDPLPDEIDASDEYGIIFGMWAADRDQQEREAEHIFGELVTACPDVPLLLMHEMQTLTLAYLPGRGTHRFPPMITPDIEFEAQCRDWVHTR